MAMHPVFFKIQHQCSVIIEGSILHVLWEENMGQKSRSFSEIEIIGSERLEDSVYLFVLSSKMIFKKYRFRAPGLIMKNQTSSVNSDLMRLHAAILSMSRSTVPNGFVSRDKLIVIVNPKSGKCQAVDIMQRISPIFRAGGIDPVVHVTTRSGHAKDIMSDVDISIYKGVVCIGGDGTVNEVLTGLLKNPMYFHAGESDFTLGVIPAGKQWTLL